MLPLWIVPYLKLLKKEDKGGDYICSFLPCNWSSLHPVKTTHNQAAKKWSNNLWKCCFPILQLISSSSSNLFFFRTPQYFYFLHPICSSKDVSTTPPCKMSDKPIKACKPYPVSSYQEWKDLGRAQWATPKIHALEIFQRILYTMSESNPMFSTKGFCALGWMCKRLLQPPSSVIIQCSSWVHLTY